MPTAANMRQVGDFDTDVSDPAWSPDSTMLAVAPAGTGAKIVIVDAATGDEIDTLDQVDGTAKAAVVEQVTGPSDRPPRVHRGGPGAPRVHHSRTPPTGVSGWRAAIA